MPTLVELEKRIRAVEERNTRVEVDKSWEISTTRKILIAILTYFVIVVFFYFAELPNPWVNSIVPAIAFLTSTLTIPIVKRLWLS